MLSLANATRWFSLKQRNSTVSSSFNCQCKLLGPSNSHYLRHQSGFFRRERSFRICSSIIKPCNGYKVVVNAVNGEGERSIEDMLKEQMQAMDGGGGSDNGRGGGGWSSFDGSESSDESFGDIIRDIIDDIKQTFYAIVIFLSVYIYIVDGPNVLTTARDFVDFYLLGGPLSWEVIWATDRWCRFWDLVKGKTLEKKVNMLRELCKAETMWYRPPPRQYEYDTSDVESDDEFGDDDDDSDDDDDVINDDDLKG